jgi:hypothetical protein
LKEGTCKFKTDLAAAFVKDVVNIKWVSKFTLLCVIWCIDYPGSHLIVCFFSWQYDEMGMLDAVAKHNPVSLAYEVTSDFMHYHSGVYST